MSSCNSPALYDALTKPPASSRPLRSTRRIENKRDRCSSRLLRKLEEYNTDILSQLVCLHASDQSTDDLLEYCLNTSLTGLFQSSTESEVRGERQMLGSDQAGEYYSIENLGSRLLSHTLTKHDEPSRTAFKQPYVPTTVRDIHLIANNADIDSKEGRSPFDPSFLVKRGGISQVSLQPAVLDDHKSGGCDTTRIDEEQSRIHCVDNRMDGAPKLELSKRLDKRPHEKALSGFDAVIDLALSSEEASSFDLPELHEAFLKFFEDGDVSDELEDYFDKVLETEGLNCFSTCNGSRSDQNKKVVSPISKPGLLKGPGRLDRRIRNNEASRRCRAAHKARFKILLEQLEKMRVEKRELCIWLREIRLAVHDAKQVLLGVHRDSELPVRNVTHNPDAVEHSFAP